MNAAIWTLWLITFASGPGTATPAVNPLATYDSESNCLASLETIGIQLRKEYGAKNTPIPGLMFCVYGTTAKR